MKYVVVYGTFAMGHTIYGPFETMGDAIFWGTTKFKGSTLWSIQPLVIVEENGATGN